jgi:uncharacterized membrane protein
MKEGGRDRLLTLGMAGLALAGAAISGYLTAVHYAGQPVFCGGLSSCETVNTSSYAEVMGVPVALLGLGAYVCIGVLALARARLSWAGPALVFVSVVGVLYSAYLTWVELTVLHAVCLWCATSAAVVTVIAGLAITAYLREEDGTNEDRGPSLAVPDRRRRVL